MLVNRAKMTTATTGTGTITLGSAVDGYQTFAAAGVTDAAVVSYAIEDGTAWEIGTGTYTASGTTLSRTVTESSNAGAAINLTGNAVIFVTARAEDLATGGGAPTLATSSGATQSVDFSASNKIHVATIDEDATISFVNPAQVAKVDLILDVGGTRYDLTVFAYEGIQSSVAPFSGFSQGTTARNGSFVYTVYGGSTDQIRQYAVSDPNDLTTLQESPSTFSTSGIIPGSPEGIGFAVDGTAMIIGDNGGTTLVAYDLITPWDITTRANQTTGTGVGNNYACAFNTDGSQYITCTFNGLDAVVRNLGTPYRLDTVTSSVTGISFSGFAFTAPRSFVISEDGNFVFVLCTTTKTVYQYPLGTNNDLSTIQNSLVASVGVAEQDSLPKGFGFVAGGSKVWIVGDANDRAYEYASGQSFAVTLPPNLQSPIISTGADEKVALQVVTYDGGTTYQAIQVQGGIA